MSNAHRMWANSVSLKGKDWNQDPLHFRSAKYRVLDERSNATASIAEHLEILKINEFYTWNTGNQ